MRQKQGVRLLHPDTVAKSPETSGPNLHPETSGPNLQTMKMILKKIQI